MALIETRTPLITNYRIYIMSTKINSAFAYRAFIKSTAESILEDIIDQEGLDVDAVTDALYDAVSEQAGNTEIAIYTHHHLNVLAHSKYAEEFCNEFGNKYAGQILADRDLSGLQEAIAVFCIEADIREWLSSNAEDIIEARIVELGGEVE